MRLEGGQDARLEQVTYVVFVDDVVAVELAVG
jgi:hypothetical protein